MLFVFYDMKTVTVRLLKPSKGQVITFNADLLRHHDPEISVRAIWDMARRDLGYVVFEPGDIFTEYYYTDRWYTIYLIHSPAGVLKGWYCNVTRPASFEHGVLTSEDLELDVFVSPDRSTLLTLDMDEFEARRFQQDDLATYHAALAALAELRRMAEAGEPPFRLES